MSVLVMIESLCLDRCGFVTQAASIIVNFLEGEGSRLFCDRVLYGVAGEKVKDVK